MKFEENIVQSQNHMKKIEIGYQNYRDFLDHLIQSSIFYYRFNFFYHKAFRWESTLQRNNQKTDHASSVFFIQCCLRSRLKVLL